MTNHQNGAPGYWMHETTGKLRPAIEAYFAGQMTVEHVAAMRAYLRQWMSGAWHGHGVAALRDGVDKLVDLASIREWMRRAISQGLDPL